MSPTTRYAKSGDVHIAFQVFGEGPVELVVTPGFISNIEYYWDEPRSARWLTAMARFARVTIFDKRGTGLSDRVAVLPTMEERIGDMRAVMDAAGIQRAALFGVSEGGSMASLFAARHPERCEALVLYGSFARFSTWFPTQEALDQFLGYVEHHWGSGGLVQAGAPSIAHDPAARQSIAKFERTGASPSAVAALMRMNANIDIAGDLGAVRAPTLVIHKTDDAMVPVAGGRELASLIPNAKLFEMPGRDHLPWFDDCSVYLAEMRAFLTGDTGEDVDDRALAVLLFSDIVDSTRRAESLGDRAWRDLLDRHDHALRRQLERFQGREVKTLGDGFLATFDGPSRAIRAAQAMREAANQLGIDIRAGLHAGEVEVSERDVRGIAVHITARISALAATNQIVVSRTVKDLVAGSEMAFNDLGTHALKGIPDEWQMFEVR